MINIFNEFTVFCMCFIPTAQIHVPLVLGVSSTLTSIGVCVFKIINFSIFSDYYVSRHMFLMSLFRSDLHVSSHPVFKRIFSSNSLC
jgi:hypothetical protein